MATVAAQMAAIAAALTAASLKNTTDPTAFTAQQQMVVVLDNGSDNLSGMSFATWEWRLTCAVPLGPKTGTTACTVLTLAVLTVARSLSGCRIVSVGPQAQGTTEGGIKYLAADVNVQMAVTI